MITLWNDKHVAATRGEYYVVVNNPVDATYVTLWTVANKRVGSLSTRGEQRVAGKPYLSIALVAVDKPHRGHGLARAMYRALLAHLHPRWAGIVSYLPDRSNHRQVPAIWRYLGGRVLEEAPDDAIIDRPTGLASASPRAPAQAGQGSTAEATHMTPFRQQDKDHPLQLYHGAQRWEGPPSIRAARKGRAEEGPGIYLTTSWSRARHFAKGAGTVRLFTLNPDIQWLEKAPALPVEVVVPWLSGLRGLPKRPEIISELRRWERPGFLIPASILNNTFVNRGLASGRFGPELAAFLVEMGIDASLVRQPHDDWVVLFNPEKVLKVERVPPTPDVFDFPRIQA